jgi:acyl-CoA synthetase (AMP-forming)/AMP-acid ligase II
MLIGDLLRRAAQRLPAKTALIDGARRWSYAELDRAADRFATALAGAGHAKGERIGVIAPNRGEVAIAYFGCARAGAILCLLSTRSTARDIAYAVNKTGIARLFVAPEAEARLAAARAEMRSTPALVILGEAGAETWDGFLARGADRAPAVDLTEDDPLAITFTGGTTGQPKAVLVTHRNRYATAVTCGVEFGLDERDVCLVATPLFHAAGLFVWFQTAIMLGCACVLLSHWDAGRAIALIEQHGCTAALLVPTQLGDLVAHPDCTPERMRSLRHMHYAGSPMAVASLDRAQAKLPLVGFTENYGQSETGPMTIRRPFHPHEKRGTSGRPCHNVETRVVDAEGRECPPGVAGEIVTRGPHAFAAYWDEPEQTSAAYRMGDGWLWTGDIGVRDADGFIELVDRAKDMIVSGAENIYPTEIENALYRHEAVAECAVFGIPDERWGEAPAAHVVLKPGRNVTAEALIAYCEREIARYKRPRLVKFVASLPRTPVGKIQKNLIRAPYWEGRERKI